MKQRKENISWILRKAKKQPRVEKYKSKETEEINEGTWTTTTTGHRGRNTACPPAVEHIKPSLLTPCHLVCTCLLAARELSAN